jgi:hypothetical protein
MPVPGQIDFADDTVWTFLEAFPACFAFFGIDLNILGMFTLSVKKSSFRIVIFFIQKYSGEKYFDDNNC